MHRDPSSNKCKFLPLGKWRKELKQEDIPTPYMRLTDTIDMVGVQLCSTWNSTRKKNGDTVREKVANVIGPWRGGKFMPLSQRPYSINTYALSKVWHRSATVNLRISDYNSINSSLKKWLYADCILKPEELALYRPTQQGGLGLVSVQHKSIATFTRSFMELAVNPNYTNSNFLNLIYRKYVLDEDVGNISLPPYFTYDFFDNIIAARNEGYNAINMSIKQWYQFFLGRNVLNGNNFEPLPCKAEIENPDLLWPEIWKSIRDPSFSSITVSFMFKLTHNLLPTESRLHSTVGRRSNQSSPFCKYCSDRSQIADAEHCLFDCDLTRDVGQWLLDTIRKQIPAATPKDVMSLMTFAGSGPSWVITCTMEYAWTQRLQMKRACVVECIAKLQADLRILMMTRHNSVAESALTLLSS